MTTQNLQYIWSHCSFVWHNAAIQHFLQDCDIAMTCNVAHLYFSSPPRCFSILLSPPPSTHTFPSFSSHLLLLPPSGEEAQRQVNNKPQQKEDRKLPRWVFSPSSRCVLSPCGGHLIGSVFRRLFGRCEVFFCCLIPTLFSLRAAVWTVSAAAAPAAEVG